MASKMAIKPIRVEKQGLSYQLVVVVHGWLGNPLAMKDLIESIRQKLPNADIAIPDYSGNLLSNISPLRIAQVIEDFIDSEVRKNSQENPDPQRRYQKIYLIGNSVGALILKQAYLLGRGITSSFHRGQFNKHPPTARDWVKLPVRLILMAGMNRGWSLNPRPKLMRFSTYLILSILFMLGRFFGVGKFIRAVQRGEPFIANMRVRWASLSLINDPLIPQPEVFQLLGQLDELVSEEDHTDILINANFILIPVVETNHENLIRFSNTPFGDRRKAIFEEILTHDFKVLATIYSPESQRVFAKQDLMPERHVVFIMHGIRDSGHWITMLQDTFRQQYHDIATRAARYQYFPMGAFLLLNQRQRYVRRFMDLYTEEVAKNPEIKISYIGHSNGTYILASALKRYSSINVENVVFAGSVVEQDYPWGDAFNNNRIQAFQNYISNKDWVVAIFPRFFELIKELFGPTVNDIGSAGFNGFSDPQANINQLIVKGTHSGALVNENHPAIALFIAKGVSRPNSHLIVHNVDATIQVCSKLCWLIWVLLIVGLVLLGFGVVYLLQPMNVPAWTVSLFYVGLVWLLLQTL